MGSLKTKSAQTAISRFRDHDLNRLEYAYLEAIRINDKALITRAENILKQWHAIQKAKYKKTERVTKLKSNLSAMRDELESLEKDLDDLNLKQRPGEEVGWVVGNDFQHLCILTRLDELRLTHAALKKLTKKASTLPEAPL